MTVKWSERKRSSLHLQIKDEERLNDLINKLRTEKLMKIRKNHLLEKWVLAGIEKLEKELDIKRGE